MSSTLGAPETFTTARSSPLTPRLVFDSCVVRWDAEFYVYDRGKCVCAIQEWASCGRKKAESILWFRRQIAGLEGAK